MTHTKSPWKWDAYDRIVAGGSETLACWRLVSCANGEEIIWVNEGAIYSEYSADCSTLEVNACDANLIAAAPDMYEALRGAEEWLAGWASAEPYLNSIQAAIKKAEG